MLNLASATLSMTTLLGFGGVASSSSLPLIATKAIRQNQITGSYDLIYPDLHKDFPTRQEVQMCVLEAFNNHHSTSAHGGLFSHIGGFTNVLLPLFIPRETVVSFMLVRAMSSVNAVGYVV